MVRVRNNGGLVQVAGVSFPRGDSEVSAEDFAKAQAFRIGEVEYLKGFFDSGRLVLLSEPEAPKAPEPAPEPEKEEPKAEPEAEERPRRRSRRRTKDSE